MFACLAYEEYLDDQRQLAFEREMNIFYIIRGIRDKVEKLTNDRDTPQERLTNQLHEIYGQLQYVEHTALWQASLQRERQSIAKNARRLIPVVAAKIAAQHVAAAELLQDTHHTYVDDEGTRRYTRGAKAQVIGWIVYIDRPVHFFDLGFIYTRLIILHAGHRINPYALKFVG